MLLGAHLSTAGGLHRACEAAAIHGFNALALFLRSPRQWKAPPLTSDAIRRFRAAREAAGIECVVAHASYLINLAGEDPARRRGLDALGDDLERCAALGIEFLVLHPGAHPDAGEGLRRIAAGLDEAMARVPRRRVGLLVEGMAGQGNSLGHRFEHLATLLASVRRPNRFGICLDTAHLFAAGFDFRRRAGWNRMLDALEATVGIGNLRAIHCNDSAKPLGSRVDRHTHIGHGEIGLSGFRHLVNDPRTRDLPLILETPKGIRGEDGRDWDDVNADTLRALAKHRARGRRRKLKDEG